LDRERLRDLAHLIRINGRARRALAGATQRRLPKRQPINGAPAEEPIHAFDDETDLMLDLDRRRPFDAQHQGRWLLALRVTRPLEANRLSMRRDVMTHDVRPMGDDLA
jgi:hypothetical protein